MKKSLMALAVLGALATAAQAQTTVTIGGVVQANVKSYSVGNSTRVTSNELRVDDDYTSRFWLIGAEDLGGGNKAIFKIENRLNTDVTSAIGDGNGLGNGDTYLGLKGSWGQATIGKHSMMSGQGTATEKGGNGTSSMPSSMYAANSIMANVGSQNLTNTRVANSVLYKSPKFSGFNFSAGLGASGSNSNEGVINGSSNYADGQQFFLSGAYSNGPMYLNLAYWSTKSEGRPSTVTASNADQSEIRLSGSYKLSGGLKFGLQFDRATLSNVGRVAGIGGADQTRSAWSVPVNYTFGANTLLASYTSAGDLSNTANTGAKMWMLGWDYALSKRTNVGVFYSKLSNDTAGTYTPYKSGTSQTGTKLTAGESASTFALAIKHIF